MKKLKVVSYHIFFESSSERGILAWHDHLLALWHVYKYGTVPGFTVHLHLTVLSKRSPISALTLSQNVYLVGRKYTRFC